MPLHPLEWLKLKRLKITSIGEDVEEQSFIIAGGNIKCYSGDGKQLVVS